MVSPSRNSRIAQPASANLTPQDILVAVNNNPQAILQYIVGLENEVNRLQQHLVASREEMYTVIQISMSAVATEMSKTLNVTKNSLIGIQEKFHRIAAHRSDTAGAVRPGVLKHYREGAVSGQGISNGQGTTSTNILGIGKEDHRLDFLTSDYSPPSGRPNGMSLPLNPTPKLGAAHYAPTQHAPGPVPMLDLSRTQENAAFPSTAGSTTPQFATTSSIFELSPTRSNAPFPRAFGGKPTMNANVKIAPPAMTVRPESSKHALSVRSDSQKNVQKTDPAVEAFMAFMAVSDKTPRSYRSIPQPKPALESTTTSPALSSVELANDTAPTMSKFTRPAGSFIKYDVASLKNLREQCKNLPNPFENNNDRELKPVLRWEPGANKVAPPARHPGLRISQTSGPPGFPSSIPVAPQSWF